MTAPVVIYGTAGAGTLIGRALNVFKHHLRATATLMAVPLGFSFLEGIFASMSSMLPTLTAPPLGQLLGSVVLTLLTALCSLLAIYTVLLFSCPLVRIYYSTLVQQEPLSVKESLAPLKKRWVAFGLLPVLVTLLLIGCIIADTITAIPAFIVISIVVGFLTASIGKMGVLVLPLMAAFVVVFAAVMVAVGLAVLGFQFQFALFPMVAMSTSNVQNDPDAPPPGFVSTVFHSVGVLFSNAAKAALFGSLLVIFWVVITTVLQMPLGIWLFVEMRRLDTSAAGMDPAVLPFHVSIVLNLVGSVARTILIPFALCAVSLFWYDCQVKKEGIDIHLSLKKLMNTPSSQTGVRTV